MPKQLLPFVITILGVIAAAVRVEAHAFLVRAEPRVGSKLRQPPTELRIWFSEPIQNALSNVQVLDATGKRVDKKDTHIDRTDRSLLHISLEPSLSPGIYKIIWRVTSVDKHVTNGDFRFQVGL
jgi:methionine-rich copper-binding protein CopC